MFAQNRIATAFAHTEVNPCNRQVTKAVRELTPVSLVRQQHICVTVRMALFRTDLKCFTTLSAPRTTGITIPVASQNLLLLESTGKSCSACRKYISGDLTTGSLTTCYRPDNILI